MSANHRRLSDAHTHTRMQVVRLNGGGLAERVETRCRQLVITRRRGETFVRDTLIDVLPDILKPLPLKEIEELILFTIIVLSNSCYIYLCSILHP